MENHKDAYSQKKILESFSLEKKFDSSKMENMQWKTKCKKIKKKWNEKKPKVILVIKKTEDNNPKTRVPLKPMESL